LQRLDGAKSRRRQQNPCMMLADLHSTHGFQGHRVKLKRRIGLRFRRLTRFEGALYSVSSVTLCASQEGS
jgi:hypothetical protein